MSFIPTIAHALADLKMVSSTNVRNPLIQREITTSMIRHSLEMMVSHNNTNEAVCVVNELIEKQIECDPSDVFFCCCAYGNVEMIKIFERYKPFATENIPQGLTLALNRGQMETAQWALQQAHARWGDTAKDHIKANELIVKLIDSHVFTLPPHNLHKAVQWLIPFNTADLSFAVVRASMREYKSTARLLLKHSDPQLVLKQIGDNHADPKMQWLMDLLNQKQHTTLKNSVPKSQRLSKRKM